MQDSKRDSRGPAGNTRGDPDKDHNGRRSGRLRRDIFGGLAPTSLGLKGVFFFGVIVLAYLAAPYLNLFFLLLGFICVFGALAVPWTYANLNGVQAECGKLRPVSEGVGAEFVVTVRAQKRRFAVNPIVRCGGRWRMLPTLATVEPGEQTHRCRIPALPRGVHAVADMALESSYPLGLLRRRIGMATRGEAGPNEIIVHPKAIDLPKGRSRSAALAALLGTTPVEGAGSEPSGLRPWRDGDELRTVHWRASARSRGLVVVEREAVADQGLEIVFDQRMAPRTDTEADELKNVNRRWRWPWQKRRAAAPEISPDDPFENALSIVTALALRSQQDETHLTVRAQGIDNTFGDGHAPWRDLMRWLALAEPIPLDAAAPPRGGAGALRLPLAKASTDHGASTQRGIRV